MENGAILGLTIVFAGTNVVLIGIMRELRRTREAINASGDGNGGVAQKR